MFTKFKIWNLKRKARNIYYQNANAYDMSCGISLAEEINPQLRIDRKKMHSYVKLAKRLERQEK